MALGIVKYFYDCPFQPIGVIWFYVSLFAISLSWSVAMDLFLQNANEAKSREILHQKNAIHVVLKLNHFPKWNKNQIPVRIEVMYQYIVSNVISDLPKMQLKLTMQVFMNIILILTTELLQSI